MACKKVRGTPSPAQVQLDLKSLRCWWLQAGKPIGNIPFETAVAKGLLHILETLNRGKFGCEPDQLQAMLTCAVSENGPNHFAGLRQASLYVVQYWGTARFPEIQDIKIS